MEKGYSMERNEKWRTTLGDLIVSLTDEIGRQVKEESQTYEVVAEILAKLFKRQRAVSIDFRW